MRDSLFLLSKLSAPTSFEFQEDNSTGNCLFGFSTPPLYLSSCGPLFYLRNSCCYLKEIKYLHTVL
ncbi:hypothetical protein GQ42DRAFT_70660 [Ramicandelaber brevisporus]|nr:hypothetical protein GQ42DRAFT_70660 [Ramicandelaber brevisporus]